MSKREKGNSQGARDPNERNNEGRQKEHKTPSPWPVTWPNAAKKGRRANTIIHEEKTIVSKDLNAKSVR
jgi:hypothetical protein